MPEVLNKKHLNSIPEDAVYVGRPTKWGNPFLLNDPLLPPGLTRLERRQMVVDEYRKWIQTQPELINALPELRGKDLVCWCAPLPCHADVLLELANS